MAHIAVIIVNYNAAELVMVGVASVLDPARSHGGHQVSVHLVDNASPDGDAAQFREAAANWGERVTLYLEDTNHGFGRGNNVALNQLAKDPNPPEYVFLLNPDAQLKNDTLAVLVSHLEAHPNCAMAGARAFNPGDPTPVTAAFRFPGLAASFSGALNFGPVARLLKRYEVALGANIPTQKVDWVSGAAVLARFDVWRSLGFFDPEYFLYYEEVDLMLSTARAGHECWHVAEAEIVHIEGASTDVRSADDSRPRRPVYWYHSWQYYFHKNYGRPYAIAAALLRITGSALHIAIARLRGTAIRTPRHFFGDFWGAGLRPLLGFGSKQRK